MGCAYRRDHRVSKTSPDPGDPIFEATAIMNLMGDLSTRIGCGVACRDPIDTLRGIAVDPAFKLQCIGEPSFGAD